MKNIYVNLLTINNVHMNLDANKDLYKFRTIRDSVYNIIYH